MQISLFENVGTPDESFVGSYLGDVLPRVGDVISWADTERVGRWHDFPRTHFTVTKVIHQIQYRKHVGSFITYQAYVTRNDFHVETEESEPPIRPA